MSSYKFKHMTLDDRITIQKSLKEGKSFVEIGALLGKDPSTISKEVRNHFEWRNTGTRSREVQLMMNHINSYTRKKLNNRSAHQLFSFFYGEDIAEKLEMKAIPANEIILKPELLK